MLVLVALIVLALVLWRNFGFQQKKISDTQYKSIPMATGYPIVGNLYDFIRSTPHNRFALFKSYFDKYGPSFRLKGFGVKSVHTCSVEFVQFILTSQKFINKGEFYKVVMPWLGTGLVTSSGRTWRQRRKMLHPAFHYTILNDLGGIASQKCDMLIKNLEAELNSDGFDVSPYLHLCTMDAIAETAMNIHLNTQNGGSKDFFENKERFVRLAGDRAVNILLHSDLLHRFSDNYKKQQESLQVLQGISTKIIQEKMKEQQEQKLEVSDSDGASEKKKCLIEILLNVSDPVAGSLSIDDIRDEVNTFLFAGHDTVATSLSWTLLLIGQHPEVQKRIFQELDEVFGDSNRWPTNDDLRQLKYIESVFMESLRMYPPIPFINRTITEDVVIDGYLVPAGTILALHIYQLHRSPEHYPNPNKFDPGNFSLDNIKKRHPYAFISFSAGPRNCIGQKYAMIEAKIILVQIMRNFEIESLYSIEEIQPMAEIIMAPDKGAQIKIRRRIKN